MKLAKLLHDLVNWIVVIGLLVLIGSIWQAVIHKSITSMEYPLIFATICFIIAIGLHRGKIYLEKRFLEKKDGIT